MFTFGAGKSAERRAAKGSIKFLGKMLVGFPETFTPIGVPQ